MTSPSKAALDASLAFARIQSYSEQIQQPPPAVQVGSVLAEDDRAASPHLVSHAVWFAHTTAVDQLEGVRALTQDFRRVHPFTQHTLLRSALENAATAVWLIAPGDRSVRLLRTLQVAAANLHESRKVEPA